MNKKPLTRIENWLTLEQRRIVLHHPVLQKYVHEIHHTLYELEEQIRRLKQHPPTDIRSNHTLSQTIRHVEQQMKDVIERSVPILRRKICQEEEKQTRVQYSIRQLHLDMFHVWKQYLFLECITSPLFDRWMETSSQQRKLVSRQKKNQRTQEQLTKTYRELCYKNALYGTHPTFCSKYKSDVENMCEQLRRGLTDTYTEQSKWKEEWETNQKDIVVLETELKERIQHAVHLFFENIRSITPHWDIQNHLQSKQTQLVTLVWEMVMELHPYLQKEKELLTSIRKEIPSQKEQLKKTNTFLNRMYGEFKTHHLSPIPSERIEHILPRSITPRMTQYVKQQTVSL